MREKLNRRDFHEAIDKTLSGLQPDPWLYRRLSARMEEGEIKVKKKLPAALVIALAIIMLTAIALAATLLSHQEVVEQVAVPMAVGNDGKVGVNESYSFDELAELVRVLNENGITLEENSTIMKALQSGQGYYEEETMMELCRQAFGGNYYTWTLEEQDWFDGLMVECGFYETRSVRKPGEGNLTYEQAEAFAYDVLRPSYGHEVSPETSASYKLSRSFYLDSERGGKAAWSFMWEPTEVTQGRYSVTFLDENPKGTFSIGADVPDWTQPYTAEILLGKFHSVHSWDEAKWPQRVWRQLHEMMQKAELMKKTPNYAACYGYQMTAYPEPLDSEIKRDEAIQFAKDALKIDGAAMNSAVLTEYEGKRAWLIGLNVYAANEQAKDQNAGLYAVTLDSVTGNAESIRKQEKKDDVSFTFVPQAAYEKAHAGLLTDDDYIRMAQEAILKIYPQYDFSQVRSYVDANWEGTWHTVRFQSETVKQGKASAKVRTDGTVWEEMADVSPVTGDNILERYNDAYKYSGFWDQKTWVQLGKDMESLTPTSYVNLPLKQTRYPEEASVSIGHEKAQELAMIATGKRNPEVNTCVLVDAKPHPVWIMRVLTDDFDNPVIGIDAETGEVVFTELYRTDYTPKYVLYSMPETWRRIELDNLGAPYMARDAVNHKFSDMSLDDPDMGLDDSSLWRTEQEGLTVRFVGRFAGMKCYEVELDEKGFVLRCEETETDSTEPMPDTLEDPITPIPTPQPDGKPWFWGMNFGDDELWDALDTAMKKYDVNPGNFREKELEWVKKYGENIQWPYDCVVLEHYLSAVDSWSFEYSHPLFVREGKKNREEIYELAMAAFHETADEEMGAAWVAGMRCDGMLNQGGNNPATGEQLTEPYWFINMLVYENENDWNPKGYVILTEDGEVIYSVLELMGNG